MPLPLELQVLAVALILSLTIGGIYHCKLLKWCADNIIEHFCDTAYGMLNGPPCSLNLTLLDKCIKTAVTKKSTTNSCHLPPIQYPVIQRVGDYFNINVLVEPGV